MFVNLPGREALCGLRQGVLLTSRGDDDDVLAPQEVRRAEAAVRPLAFKARCLVGSLGTGADIGWKVKTSSVDEMEGHANECDKLVKAKLGMVCSFELWVYTRYLSPG